MLLGSHLSIAKGLSHALVEAERLGLDTVQVFTKNQRQWRVRDLKDEARESWLEKLGELGWTDRVVAHNSYLINMASPVPELREKSVDLMRIEFDRCDDLSIRYLVAHPGAHTTSSPEAGRRHIAESCATLLDEFADSDVVLCLENTAGAGTTIGRTFEELAELRSMILDKAGADFEPRLGFCFDTCHALAGGYEFGDKEAAERTLDELDTVCGLENVRVVHVNDSKAPLGSRKDRHEHIGEGEIGLEPFSAVVNRAEFAETPMIMETPKGETDDGVEFDEINKSKLEELAGRETAESA